MEDVTRRNVTNGSTTGNGIFYVVPADSYIMQQQKNCWRQCFLLDLSRGYITRTNRLTVVKD
jgi:hypothetical protein